MWNKNISTQIIIENFPSRKYSSMLVNEDYRTQIHDGIKGSPKHTVLKISDV